MRKLSKKIVIGAAATAIVAAGAGVAFAYWTASGSGTGTGATGTSTAFGVSATAVSGLVPGGSANSTLTLTNSTTSSQHFNGVNYAVTGLNTGCSASDFSVTGLPSNDTIAPNAHKDYTVVVNFADDPAVSQDACKNSALTITYTLN